MDTIVPHLRQCLDLVRQYQPELLLLTGIFAVCLVAIAGAVRIAAPNGWAWRKRNGDVSLRTHDSLDQIASHADFELSVEVDVLDVTNVENRPNFVIRMLDEEDSRSA